MKKMLAVVLVVIVLGSFVAYAATDTDISGMVSEQAGDLQGLMGLIAKIIVAVASPLAALAIATYLVMRFHNFIRRRIGQSAYRRMGLGVKSTLRIGTATGSVLARIHRENLDGFFAYVLPDGDATATVDEEIFFSWIGWECAQVNIIRNIDLKEEPKKEAS